jgi:hypothetical protein
VGVCLAHRLVGSSDVSYDLNIGSRVEQALQSKANDLVIIHQQYPCVRHITKYTRATPACSVMAPQASYGYLSLK